MFLWELLISLTKVYFFQHRQNQHCWPFFWNKSDSRDSKTDFDPNYDIHRKKAVDLPVILVHGLGGLEVVFLGLEFFSTLRTEVSLLRWTASYTA